MKWIESTKVFIRKTLPSKYGYFGNYASWQQAAQQCAGYDAGNILEKVKEATLKVKNGETVYERDSVLFDIIEYSWPLVSALLWVAALNKGKISVLDFGGSLGSSYFQNKKFLDTLNTVQWNIVEQASFVAAGQQAIENETLHFFNSVDEVRKQYALPDLLLIACTLPYIEQPYQLLHQLMQHRFQYIIIDNTPFNDEAGDRVTIQKVPPQIYAASYPCWLLDYNKVKATINEQYTIFSEHKNDSYIYVDGRKITYKGFIAKLKEGNR
jgi:putative methyltransferase (TIGR04325 family)